MSKTKELSKDTRDVMVHLNKTRMCQSTTGNERRGNQLLEQFIENGTNTRSLAVFLDLQLHARPRIVGYKWCGQPWENNPGLQRGNWSTCPGLSQVCQRLDLDDPEEGWENFPRSDCYQSGTLEKVELHPQNTIPTVKHRGGIKICSCYSVKVTGRLICGKKRMNVKHLLPPFRLCYSFVAKYNTANTFEKCTS